MNNQALNVLERCILSLAPKHHASRSAPNNYSSLNLWHMSHTIDVDSLPVFNGGSEKTIYSSDKVNFAFRAWHDYIHILFGYTFSYDDELKVAKQHVRMLLEWADKNKINYGLTLQAAELVYADVAGQVEYYYHHKKYVDNQKAFVYDYINNGFELNKEMY